MAVSVEDLGVHLSGKGSTATVLTASAMASSDLRERIAARQVSISSPGLPATRMWPLAERVVLPPLPPPSQPPPSSPPPASLEYLQVLKDINEKLGVLVLRPSPPPAEVVAAHVRAVAQAGPVPQGLPGAPHPQFIPSTILPDGEGAGADIKVSRSDVPVDVGPSVSALRDLRRKK